MAVYKTITGAALWIITTALGIAYIAMASSFVSVNLSCVWNSKRCTQHVKTFNDGLNAGCILTIVLIALFAVISLAFIVTKKKYLEAMCLASSYNLAVTMLLYSISLHTAYPLIIQWKNNKTKNQYVSTYQIGYVLAGLYGLWIVCVLVIRAKSNRSSPSFP